MRKVKKKEKLKLRKKGEEDGEKRKREEEKRRECNGDGLKEDVMVLFLWKHLIFLVKGEIWRVAEMFLGNNLSEELEGLSDCELAVVCGH